jgi:hypothetical protein
MVDIFLSYDPSDMEVAADLAEALESVGWSVSWYREISPGRSYDATVREALGEARSVIVLWTRASIVRRWVVDEAQFGADRGILVAALLDDVEVPRGFEGVPTTRLVGWDGSATFEPLRRLLRDVSDGLVTGPAADVGVSPSWAVAFERRSEGDVRAAVDALMEAGLEADMLDEVIASVFRHFPPSERDLHGHPASTSMREPARVAARLGVLRRAVPDLLSTDKLDVLARLPKVRSSPTGAAAIVADLRS